MIICPKCTKENQDHYKFCLGCGAELPRDAAPKKFAPASNTPPHGIPAVKSAAPPSGMVDESTSQGQGPSATAAAVEAATGGGGDTVVCPQCSHTNPTTNKFCASCGFKLGKAASVPAPQAQPQWKTTKETVSQKSPNTLGPANYKTPTPHYN